MDTKFSIQNDVEEEMGIIHEESSDEDNSSKDEHQTGVEDRETNPVRPTVMGQRVKRTEATKKQGLDFWNLRAILKQNKGEISDIKSRENSNKLIGPLKKERSGKNLISEKLSKQNSDFAEEEKFNKKENRGTFEGFRDIFDRNRDQRSSSCKSATASLQFSNNRFFRKQFTSSPFKPLPKRSYKISSSTSKRRTHVSSFVGVANGKATEPSLIDFRKQMESHSKCLSEVSRRLSRRRSDTRMSVPINRYPSNSSLSSEYSGRIGNTSTTTFTSDITWEFRSCKLQPLDPRYKSHLVDAEFPFINNEKRNKMKMMRQFSRVGETLPELIEWEEKLEEEFDLFSSRHRRINIMKDLNEFGRKGKRHRSLDGGRKRKAITPQWQYDVSETEEEDSISDADLEKDNKSKSFSKISRIFNKIYADHFERPIRMKQIKERNNRNINTLGDTPINEDSHDSSEESREENPSENSSSNLSFKRRYVRTFFDKIDKPENKTVSASQKYYEIISEPILEGEEENEGAENNSLIRSETYEKFKSRHNRWKFFDNVLDAKEPGTSRRKSFMKTTSSFDNEPIVEENIEENDEENEQVDPYYHHFKRSLKPDETKSTDKQVEDLL